MFMKDVPRFAGGNCVSCPKAHKCGVYDGVSAKEGARAIDVDDEHDLGLAGKSKMLGIICSSAIRSCHQTVIS